MGSLRFTPSQAFWEDVVEAARPGLAEVADAVQVLANAKYVVVAKRGSGATSPTIHTSLQAFRAAPDTPVDVSERAAGGLDD